MARLFITQFLKSDLNYTNPQGQQPRMKNSGWAPGMFCIFYRITQEVLSLVLSRTTQDIYSHTKWSALRQEPQHLLPNSCLRKTARYFKIPWDFRLLSRYVYEWEVVDTTCCAVIVSYRPVVKISVLCRLQCVRSHWNDALSSIVS